MPAAARQPSRFLANPWWLLAIPAAFTLWRLIYLAAISPLELSEDEAMYWDWSRHLDLGYYTKPGGIAWIIRASTEVFGHTEFAVRLPAVLAGFVTATFVGLLARDMFRDRAERHTIAALAAFCALAVPAFAVLGVLITIDAPYLACWAVAAWAGHRALVLRDAKGWPLLALAIGLGFQFKPTILLLLPGLLLAAWLTRAARKAKAPWGMLLLGLLIFAAALIPTVLYNLNNDAVQIAHLLEHLGYDAHAASQAADPIPAPTLAPEASTSPGWSPLWTLEVLPIQLVSSGSVGVLALIALAKLWKRRSLESSDVTDATWASTRYAVALAAPLLGFYVLVSFFTRVEGNWPIAAWISMAPLAAWAIELGLRERDRGLRLGGLITAGIAVGIPAIFLALPLFHLKQPLGLKLPAHRLMGYRAIAESVDQGMQQAQAETGQPPFAMAVTYGRTALLSFYLPDQPTVYCAGRYREGGSGRQYDLWAHTDLENPATHTALAGRPAVLVQWPEPFWLNAFDTATQIDTVQRKPDQFYPIWIGTDYRGWDEPVAFTED